MKDENVNAENPEAPENTEAEEEVSVESLDLAGEEEEEALSEEELAAAREESAAVLEAYLAESGGGAVTEGEALAAEWYEEELPEGHQSGFVALVGRPNVGKSTLVNALVGQKVSIVSRKPQTTRTRVTGILTEEMYQLIFIDTPGIHKDPHFELNRLMIEQAVSAIPDADALLFVVDVAVRPREEDRLIARILSEKAQKRPVIFVLNKMDRLALEDAEKRIHAYWDLFPDYADSMPTSALHGTNVERLRDHILRRIPEGPRYYPGEQLTDQTEYQIAAELVREAMFKYTYQEVPHSAAVLVETYQERDNGVTYIDARIWVDRPSQKAIVIGKDGERLKQIGVGARQELERFIGGQVYLDLWVQVQPKWRDNVARLQELGY